MVHCGNCLHNPYALFTSNWSSSWVTNVSAGINRKFEWMFLKWMFWNECFWVNVFEKNVLKWMFLSECFWKECFQMLTCTKSRLADRPRAMQWKQQVQKYACIQHVVTTSVKYEAELSYNNTLFSTPTRWSAQQHTDQHSNTLISTLSRASENVAKRT